MLMFISPAKSLDFNHTNSLGESSTPYFLDEARKVNSGIKKKSRKALMELQGISRQLAELNFERNQNWQEDGVESVQAIMAFKGDVYLGMQAELWSERNMEFAKSHLYILSGLYGMLKPNDLIKPYRLEMGTRLKVGRRENLYKFWEDKIKNYFKDNIDPEILIVNLASNEYFKAIESAKIPNQVLSVDFKDYSNGNYKIVSFFAKKARGMMTNYLVKNEVSEKEAVKGFDEAGYFFDEKSSTQDHYIFLRDKQEKSE